MTHPGYVTFQLSYCLPHAGWGTMRVQLPKREEGEREADYWNRVIAYLRQAYHVLPEATLVLKGEGCYAEELIQKR